MTHPAEERGSITLWVLGLCMLMLFVGGISLDLWRAFSERRALAGAVDAAAVAGSSGIDAAHYRETNELLLDPGLAEELATENLAAQPDTRSLVGADIAATSGEVVVRATGRVSFTLLRLFMPDAAPFTVTVEATADPRRSP
ncbi:MAG TPA: pilus assembly protein TadG-related protein [Acidimicrobiales bacterium]|nr:pilus assembly protein TadG-related protein [Acidimicrobiales bacterium]